MQVSWIDADRIKALVAQLAPPEPRVDETSQVVEISTEPETATGFMDEEPPLPPVETMPASVSRADEIPQSETIIELSETIPAVVTQETLPQEPVSDEFPPLEDDHGHGPLHNPAAALPLSRIRDKLRAIRQRAAEAGILTRGSEPPAEREAPTPEIPAAAPAREAVEAAPAVSSAVPEFVIPTGSRDERLSAFAAWSRQVLHEGGGHVLVMNDDGEVLWGGESKAGLILSTMMAWGAAMKSSTLPASEPPQVIRQPLSSGHVLTVIPCATAKGIIHATVVAPEGLPDALADVLRGGLCAAINTEQTTA